MTENPNTPTTSAAIDALAELMARNVRRLVAEGRTEAEAIELVREQWLEELRGPACRHCGRPEIDHGTLGWCDPLLIRRLSISTYSGPGSIRFTPETGEERRARQYHRPTGSGFECELCGRRRTDPLHNPAGRRTSSSSPHVRSGHYVEELEPEPIDPND